MTLKSPEQPRLLVTSGTTSWEREGARIEHEVLKDFLEEVATTTTIRTAISRSVDSMRLRPGSRVLDVGCGTGVAFPALAARIGPSGRIVGLDHAAEFLADAHQRSIDGAYANQTELFQGDAHALPFANDSFDAAHTERVLMHVSDPDQALAEMRRVVKPGGWISCVEPDLSGMRMDHEEPASASAIIAGFCASIRNSAMGLELARRMGKIGLVDISIEVITEVERELSPDDIAFYRKAGERAIELGLIDESGVARAIESMSISANSGTFVSYSTMFIVSGAVPGG